MQVMSVYECQCFMSNSINTLLLLYEALAISVSDGDLE